MKKMKSDIGSANPQNRENHLNARLKSSLKPARKKSRKAADKLPLKCNLISNYFKTESNPVHDQVGHIDQDKPYITDPHYFDH